MLPDTGARLEKCLLLRKFQNHLPGKHVRDEGQLDNGAFQLSEAKVPKGSGSSTSPWPWPWHKTRQVFSTAGAMCSQSTRKRRHLQVPVGENCKLRFGFTSQVRLAVRKSTEILFVLIQFDFQPKWNSERNDL